MVIFSFLEFNTIPRATVPRIKSPDTQTLREKGQLTSDGYVLMSFGRFFSNKQTLVEAFENWFLERERGIAIGISQARLLPAQPVQISSGGDVNCQEDLAYFLYRPIDRTPSSGEEGSLNGEGQERKYLISSIPCFVFLPQCWASEWRGSIGPGAHLRNPRACADGPPFTMVQFNDFFFYFRMVRKW